MHSLIQDQKLKCIDFRCTRLFKTPISQCFKHSAFKIIGVGTASAENRQSVNVLRHLTGIKNRITIILRKKYLQFLIFVGNDILKPYSKMMSLEGSSLLQLNLCSCDVYFTQLVKLSSKFRSAPAIACAIYIVTVKQCKTTLVIVTVCRIVH